MVVLELVQEEQVAPEKPKDYKLEEGYIQSAHVNHQYHYYDHHAIANHYCRVMGYQTVTTPFIAMWDH